MFRTSYSIVAVPRQVPNQFALVWFSQYAPSSSSYAPFYVASAAVPLPYSRYIKFDYYSQRVQIIYRTYVRIISYTII
jgi:dipeptidase